MSTSAHPSASGVSRLVSHWLALREQGLPCSPEVVCPDPLLRSKLAAVIDNIERMERVQEEIGRPLESADRTRHGGGETTAVADGLAAPPGLEVHEELGQGGMGQVFRAVQTRLNRQVALKMILSGRAADRAETARFVAEAEAMAAVRHPNVVQVYDGGEHDGRPYLTMELLTGGTLKERMPPTGMPATAAAELVEKLARGVHAAHEAGIVHRDLKPGNVLFDAAGTPKVTDFGLAKRAAVDQTHTNAVMGTPAYMPPEQARGEGKFAGPPADVWSLGVMLYECLTGERPFAGKTALEVMDRITRSHPERPGAIRPVPRDLERVCLKCLAKEPADRYRTAAALADDLKAFRDGRPVTARPVSAVVRAWKWVKRNPVPTAVMLVLLGGLIGLTYLFDRATRAERERKQELATSYVRQADLAMQRGNWADAETALNRALAEGHPNPANVRLARAKVYFNQGRYDEAGAELDHAERVLGVIGQAKLLRADMALGADNTRALQYAREALDLDLSAADREYAQALLCDNLLDADAHYQAILRREPFHLRANQLRAWGLLVLGRREEVRSQLAAALAYFPDDRDLFFLKVVEAAQSGRVKEAEEAVRADYQGEDLKLGLFLIRLFAQLRDVEELMAAPTKTIRSLVNELTSVAPTLGKAGAPSGVGRANLRIIIPPPVAKLFAPFGDFKLSTNPVEMIKLMQGLMSDETRNAVADALRDLPEGLAYMVRGRRAAAAGNDTAARELFFLGRHFPQARIDTAAGEWTTARELFVKAMETPAILNVRRYALSELADVELRLAATAPAAERKKWAYQAAVHVKELYENGGLPKAGGNERIERFIAAVASERNMASMRRRMIEDYYVLDPDRVAARLLRAQALQETGAFGPALDMYTGLLKSKSAGGKAAAGVEACRKALQEQADKLAK